MCEKRAVPARTRQADAQVHSSRRGTLNGKAFRAAWRLLNQMSPPPPPPPDRGRLHGGLERSDRLRLCPQDPPRLVIAHRHRRDGLRLAHAHLPSPDRFSQERPVAEPSRQPRHLHRRARVDPELFPGVVADVGVAQVHRPPSDVQRVQALADGDVEGAITGGNIPEQRIHLVRRPATEDWIPHSREPRGQRSRGTRHCFQPRIELGALLAHGISVPSPSDIPAAARTTMATRTSAAAPQLVY